MIVDLTKDAGFEKFAEMYVNGEFSTVSNYTDIGQLVEKQAYAEDNTFADTQNRMFSIASKVETEISARYAEKVAYMVDYPVLDAIDEKCAIYGLPLMKRASEPVIQPGEMFPLLQGESEKYAGVTEYGTELNNCLAARAIAFPDEAEGLEELSKLASEIPCDDMVGIIRDFDERVGADYPMMQSRLGTPEYAVYEKRASLISVDLGTKQVPIERIAEVNEKLADMGIDIDFDANDAYTTKLAIERLPKNVLKEVAKYV